jgi:predicted Zn-dependent protease
MKQDVCEKLCKDFKVDAEICEEVEKLYSSEIEKKLQLRHLSHLVSTIEDKINDLYKEKYIIPFLNSDQYSDAQKRTYVRRNFRLYSILLRPIEGLRCKGRVIHFNYGAIIVYDPNLDERDIRILVAHEIGHIINIHILHCPDTQNRANVLCFFAINGKNMFYKEGAKKFTYTSELAIIDEIFKLSPIKEYNQT